MTVYQVAQEFNTTPKVTDTLSTFTTEPPQMDYYIVDFTPDSVEKIAVYKSYQEADENLDHFCSVYPNSYIDIMSEDDIIAAQTA